MLILTLILCSETTNFMSIHLITFLFPFCPILLLLLSFSEFCLVLSKCSLYLIQLSVTLLAMILRRKKMLPNGKEFSLIHSKRSVDSFYLHIFYKFILRVCLFGRNAYARFEEAYAIACAKLEVAYAR